MAELEGREPLLPAEDGNEATLQQEAPAAPQPGTLDIDLMITKLLAYKKNPGKQVMFVCGAMHGRLDADMLEFATL